MATIHRLAPPWLVKSDATKPSCSRPKSSLRSDSGVEIVKRLGYTNIVELNELDYRRYDMADLFVATGELGNSIFFSAAAEQLTGKILFSGARGDKTWSKDEDKITTTIENFFYSDIARKEFRLVTGYLNLPLPFIGVMRHRDIWKVTISEEMRPWRLGNDYDRPIPRRIVEEKGVPRGLFGFSKGGGCGTSLRFGTLATLRRTMPPASYARFVECPSKGFTQEEETLGDLGLASRAPTGCSC